MTHRIVLETKGPPILRWFLLAIGLTLIAVWGLALVIITRTLLHFWYFPLLAFIGYHYYQTLNRSPR